MTDINRKLEVLYDVLIDNPEEFENELTRLIHDLSKINDTNKFASLLSNLNNPVFIPPLLKKIKRRRLANRLFICGH